MKRVLVIVGILLLLAGIVFSLQGANVIGGSALMSGNPTYIYVGIVVALVGVVLAALGFRSKGMAETPPKGS
jgi:hypothetical protein